MLLQMRLFATKLRVRLGICLARGITQLHSVDSMAAASSTLTMISTARPTAKQQEVYGEAKLGMTAVY